MLLFLYEIGQEVYPECRVAKLRGVLRCSEFVEVSSLLLEKNHFDNPFKAFFH